MAASPNSARRNFTSENGSAFGYAGAPSITANHTRMGVKPDSQLDLPSPTTRRDLAGLIGRATISGYRNRQAFRDVERFCLLLGYARSGSTLVGSLLNAHPEIVIAQEADALRYVRAGLTRNQLFAIILDRDRQFADIGRRFHGFEYELSSLDQGRYTQLRVIGDKHASRATKRLHKDPGLLDRLRDFVGVPLGVIQLERNPFDTIASLARNRDIPISKAISVYRRLGHAVDEVRGRLGRDEVLEIRYESIVSEPDTWLPAICRFLGVDAPDNFVQTCSSIVEPSGHGGRVQFDYSRADRDAIDEIIASRPALAGYSFSQ